MTLPGLGLWSAILGASLLNAGELSSYRGFQFGMDLTAAAKHVGVNASEARVVHSRPAVIQELDWQPGLFPSSHDADPMKDGLLCFYNSELFRIIITYDRNRVAGMTVDDIISAISATYGSATRPKAEIAYHSNYGEVAPVLARWEDSQYSYNLVRSGYGDSYAMVMYSKRLDGLATAAITDAIRLDAAEAPERAIEAKRKQRDEDRLALEKARAANAPNFRP